MKVIEIANNWPTETFILRHLKAMQTTKLSVQLIARHGNSEHTKGASIAQSGDDLPGQVMPNFDHLSALQKILNLKYVRPGNSKIPLRDRVLLGYFERMQPDLIHFHDASLAALMCWIPGALKIPYTLSLRGSDIQIFPFQSSAEKDAILSAIEKAAKVHAVCRALGMRAAQLLGHDFHFSTIYTTLPMPTVLPVWGNRSVDGPIHFLASGRFIWLKGFSDLLIAMRGLCDNGMDVRLTLVGVGPDLGQLLFLRNMLSLESVVSLPGKLSYKQIQHLFATAHAYIQSSVAEGLSNALAEAMANGLPVFATDVGGTSEVIEDSVSGVLLPPLSPKDWVQKLAQVQDNAQMQSIRQAAYNRAQYFFSEDQHASAFATFYNDVHL